VTEATREMLRQAMPAGPLPEYMTTHELADLMRTSPESVRFWRHVGKGPRSFKAGRAVLYARHDVEEWLSALRRDQNARAT
jgi:hypothetical protein